MTATPAPPGDEDGGLQFERTAFAWWRTSLAAVVAGALVLRQASAGVERWSAVVVTVLAVGGLLALATWRTRTLTRRSVAAAGPGRNITAALILAIAALQVIAVILVL